MEYPEELITDFGCKECGNNKWDKIPDYETLYECSGCGYPENMREEPTMRDKFDIILIKHAELFDRLKDK